MQNTIARIIRLGAAAFILIAAGPASAADDSLLPTDPAVEDGVVNAAALRPIAPGAAMAVLAWDNSAENEELAGHIEEQLRLRGFTVVANAPLTLKFAATDVLGRWSDGSRRRVVELDGRAGTGTEDEARVTLNLYSSDKGGVFNEADNRDRSVASTYSLEMTIDGRNGVRLWQGQATAKVTSDRLQLAKLMVPVLLDNLGRTVRNQPFGVK